MSYKDELFDVFYIEFVDGTSGFFKGKDVLECLNENYYDVIKIVNVYLNFEFDKTSFEPFICFEKQHMLSNEDLKTLRIIEV